MKNQFLLAFATVSALLFSGCTKNDDETADQNSSNVTYQVTATNRNNQLDRITTGRTQGFSITWTGGYINTSEIKFEAKGDNKIEFKSNAVRHIDLFDAANAIGAIGDIAVAPATYEKIEFKTTLVPVGTQAAFELTGFYVNNGDTVPVVIRFDKPIEFKFEKKTPTTIDAGAGFAALNTLSLDLLTADITSQMLNSATLTNNSIVISSSSNSTLYELAWNALEGVVKVEIKKK
jgi:major membrane immunogen (membrane-anchored lipoprotein)